MDKKDRIVVLVALACLLLGIFTVVVDDYAISKREAAAAKQVAK